MSEFVKDQAHRDRIEKGEEVSRVSPGTDRALGLIHRLERVRLALRENKWTNGAEVITDAIAEISRLRSGGAAQPPTAPKPVAWRWRAPGAVNWIYDPTLDWLDGHKNEIEAEPLYSVPPFPVAGEIQDWITYADRLEKVLEVVAGSSTDALNRSQAQEGLRLVRPSPVSSTDRGSA